MAVLKKEKVKLLLVDWIPATHWIQGDGVDCACNDKSNLFDITMIK